jgi:hypothetical protein
VIGHATAHRRANAFAQALEAAAGAEPGSTPEPTDPQQGRLLAMASALADLPKPTLDPEVKTVQRAQLVAAMEAALADGSLRVPAAGDPGAGARLPEQRGRSGVHRAGAGLRRLRPRTRWSRRLAAGGLTVGVAAGAFSGVAAASTNALPGDTLYGLKRGMEDLRLGMAGDDADRGKLLLGMATTRLQEAHRLMERRRSGPLTADSIGEMRGALLGMHNEASEGHQLLSAAYRQDGSLAPIEALNDFSQQQRRSWAALRNQLPAQLSGLGAQVSSVFDAIEREVAPLKDLLPAQPGPGTGRQGVAPGGLSGTHDPTAPGSASASGGPGDGRHSSGPSAATTSGQGLIGGSGLLDPPSADGSPSAGGSPSSGSGRSDGKGQPDVTLPPVLPGLLPGLGISTDDDK